MEIYYFAYGSNMSEKRMINRGLTPLSKQLGTLENYKFIINKKSYKNPNLGFANVMPSENDYVEGILYKIKDTEKKDNMTDAAEIISSIDISKVDMSGNWTTSDSNRNTIILAAAARKMCALLNKSNSLEL